MNFTRLISAILICQLAGIIGSFFTMPSIGTWYATLAKPDFTPPSWSFGPVWISLYALMGVSLYLLWEKKAKTAGIFFGIQLSLNALWSIIFFGLQSPFYAFIEIIFLWLAIVLTIFYSFRVSEKAAYLMIPYLLWVSFAALLNYSIAMLN